MLLDEQGGYDDENGQATNDMASDRLEDVRASEHQITGEHMNAGQAVVGHIAVVDDLDHEFQPAAALDLRMNDHRLVEVAGHIADD